MFDFGLLKSTAMGMTCEEIEEAVRHNAVVLFPVGVVEAHGPHLPLGTDAFISLHQVVIIKEAFEKAGRTCVIAPPFYFGGTQAMTRQFAGTFTASEEHIVIAVKDILTSLDRFGFKRTVVLNAHGDDLQKRAMIRAIKESNREMTMKCYWPEYEDDLPWRGFTGKENYLLVIDPAADGPVAWSQTCGSRVEFDIHAGAYETAMMLDISPDQVRTEKIKWLPPVDLQGNERGLWNEGNIDNIGLVPNAYVGDPESSKYIHCRMKLIWQDYAASLMRKLPV